MNRRIPLESVAVRLREQLSQLLDIARVGTVLDHDFLSAVALPANWPGVWVGGQRSTPVSTSRRTGLLRQEVRIELPIRVIVKKVVAGEISQEQRLNDITDAVVDALMGWQPIGAEKSLAWERSQDGPPEQSLMTVDLVFATQNTYQYAPTGA